MSTSQKKVVVIGGGTGLPVLLRGLKHHPVSLSAIVTVADDGGSSGRLRKDLDIPPPGDIRNVLAALSDVEPLVEQMFQHRFKTTNELAGHSLGNLIIAAMTNITGDFVHAVQEMSRVLNVRGTVLPAAKESVVLHAEMSDGTIVSGESAIPLAKKEITRVFLTPAKVETLPETLQAIEEADLILIGPGSLYTSIIPNLLVPGIQTALQKAKAEKIYICNLMTQPGETLNYSASDHIEALFSHLGGKFIDTILVNNEQVPTDILEQYKEELAQPVVFDIERLHELGLNVLIEDILTYQGGYLRHKTDRVAKLLVERLAQSPRS